MARSRGKVELYEVLRRTGGVKGEPAPEQEARPLPAVSAGGKPFVALRISLSVFVVSLAVFAAVIVGAFLLGARVGETRARGMAQELGQTQGEPGDAAGARTPRGAVPVVRGSDARGPETPAPATDREAFYAVRAVTLRKSEEVAALNVKKALEERTGYQVTVSLVRGYLVFYVGRFSSADDPDLGKLLKGIRDFRVGYTSFKDAHIVRLREKR